MSTAKQDGLSPGRAGARPGRSSAAGAVLSRVIWRWHFWAGLLVGPLLFVASVTGAVYLFKAEIQGFLYPHLFHGASEGPRVALTELVDVAQRSVGAEWTASSVDVDNQAGGVHSVNFLNADFDHRYLYVDANRGEVLGEMPKRDFLTVVLDIHRRLFLGTPGRV
ncbi:MAG: PepSY-associated TM helix domain-containing protein, partial [Planctomycetota bacterium]